ncbi:flagellar hook-length control protein FliK [Sphingomonas sp.]|jgi:flagellar hook-length control protein FliK|uniref:flagellar hook-length control protein FliK n=1 Tax=Sphingomonas sp. TaxID=28214 RepID=UPI0035655E7F
MIDLLPITTAPPTILPAPGGNGAATGAFEQTLGAFLDARDAAATAAGTPALTRQPLADDGNALPSTPTSGTETDDQDPAILLPWALPPTALAPVIEPPVIEPPAPGGDAAQTAALEPAAQTSAPAIAAQPGAASTPYATRAQSVPTESPSIGSDVANPTPPNTVPPPLDKAGAAISRPDAASQNPALISDGIAVSRVQVAKTLADAVDLAGFTLATDAVASPNQPIPAAQTAAAINPSVVVVAPVLAGSVPPPRSAAPSRAAVAYVGQPATPSRSVSAPTPPGGGEAAPNARAADVRATVAVATTTPRDATPAPVTAKGTSDTAGPTAREPVAPPVVQHDAAVSTIAVSTTPQPAGQVFAAAIAAATAWRDRVGLREDGDVRNPEAGITLAPTLDLQGAVAVQATGKANGAPLDLGQDQGLQRVIDHIETLRDNADAHDTRIKLTPDALGSVDVAVRQEGDRVHVRFTAEHEATRALIAEAQPRLAELAAARGVRIGDTSVTADPSGGGNASTRQPPPNPQIARTPTPVTTEADAPTDHRLA